MKKTFFRLLVLLCLFAGLPAALAAGPAGTLTTSFYSESARQYEAPVQTDLVLLTLDGAALTPPDVPPLIQYVGGAGRTLVPVRLVAEALNADVLWVNDTRQVIIQKDSDTIVLTLGSPQATVNGKLTDLPGGIPAGAVKYNGRESTMVPLRFVSETLGAQVEWDNDTFTAAIRTKAPEPTPVPTPEPTPSPSPSPEPSPSLPDRGKIVRITEDDNAQTVFIATDHVPEHRVVDLGDRVAVDLLGTVIDPGDGSISVENEVITGVRFAQHGDDLGYGYAHTVRVVFDLDDGYTCTGNIQVEKRVGGVLVTSYHSDDTEPELPSVPVDPSSALIVIDPGHGGSASGAYYEEIKEKDLTFPISLKLRDILEAQGYIVVMTRDDDSYMTLADRCQVANDLGADLFVSIHCNALENNTNYTGLITFYSTGSTQGQKLAQAVQDAASAATGAINRGIRNNSDYTVLRKTKMPAILVETGFMSNHEELMALADSAYQQRLAQGIADGITQYLSMPRNMEFPEELPSLPEPSAA